MNVHYECNIFDDLLAIKFTYDSNFTYRGLGQIPAIFKQEILKWFSINSIH